MHRTYVNINNSTRETDETVIHMNTLQVCSITVVQRSQTVLTTRERRM